MAARQRAAVDASERTATPPLKKRHFISLSYPRRNFRENCGPRQIALSQTVQPPAPDAVRRSGVGCPVCLLTRASNGPARLPTPAFRGSGLRAPSLRAHSGGAVPDFHGLPVYRTRRIGFSRLFHHRESRRRVSRPKCAAGGAGATRCSLRQFFSSVGLRFGAGFQSAGGAWLDFRPLLNLVLPAEPAALPACSFPIAAAFPHFRRLEMGDDPAARAAETAACRASSIWVKLWLLPEFRAG